MYLESDNVSAYNKSLPPSCICPVCPALILCAMTELPDGFTPHLLSAEAEICNVRLAVKVTEHVCRCSSHFCLNGVKNVDIKTGDGLNNLNLNQQ